MNLSYIMLKHCQSRTGLQASPVSNMSNSMASLTLSQTTTSSGDSEVSFDSSFGSTGGTCAQSPTPQKLWVMSSQNSLTSANEPLSLTSSSTTLGQEDKVSLKIYASCLRPDIEYKTLSVNVQSTSRDLIWQLLSKFKMKHRDPKLFYLTMEVVIGAGSPADCSSDIVKRTLLLDEEAKPAELSSCNPWNECKFILKSRKGGLVRIYDSILMKDSKYKSLLISEDTTVVEVVKILFQCYALDKLSADAFSLYEHCKTQNYERKLNHEDRPLAVQDSWLDPEQFRLVLRRTPSMQRQTKGSIHQLGLPNVPVHGHAMTDMGARAMQANLIEKYSKFCQKYESYFYV